MPRYSVPVVVEAKNAEEAERFVENMLGDIRWDEPLEVGYVGDAEELEAGGEGQ